MKSVRIGTRGSQLALWQAEYIKALLEKQYPDLKVELVIIKTKGDKILDVALSKIGDKGLFTKELENSLLNNETDIAVHSLKDVPTMMDEALTISAIPVREISNDIFISNKYGSFAELPEGAVVGTSSLRRKSQLSYLRKDLTFKDLRGNVNTRLAKLDEGQYDAIILAYAGIKRLGFDERIREKLDFETCLPAVGQGAVAVQSRTNDTEINEIVAKINHLKTNICVNTERTFLRVLEGGCQIPIGCQAWFENGMLKVSGLVADVEGNKIIRKNLTAVNRLEEFEMMNSGNREKVSGELGRQLAEAMIEMGAAELIKDIR